MVNLDQRFRQTVLFVGPEPVVIFDPGFQFGGCRRAMYHPTPDREMAEADFHRRLLEHAANVVMKHATDEREGKRFNARPCDVDLGPLGTLKNVSQIISIDFRQDLKIEYECWLHGEFDL